MFSQSYSAGQPKKKYVKVVFIEKSDKIYIFPSTTFAAFYVAFERLSRL
jgi:hypothetical protein